MRGSTRRSTHGGASWLASRLASRRVRVRLGLILAGACVWALVSVARLGPALALSRGGESSWSWSSSRLARAAPPEEASAQAASSSPTRECPVGSEIVLLFPHVNKAGGRSMEATFASLDELRQEARHRFASMQARSRCVARWLDFVQVGFVECGRKPWWKEALVERANTGGEGKKEQLTKRTESGTRRTHSFSLVNGHRTYADIAQSRGCLTAHGVSLACEHTTPTSCARWAFLLREPVARTVSAFYTTTGRGWFVRRSADIASGRTSHFYCAKGSEATRAMQSPAYNIETWARLPLAARQACDQAFNVHVKYLAPEEQDGSEEQLALAKRRLEAMAWFGVMEQWTESMRLLAHALGTDLVHYVRLSNSNAYDRSLSDTARRVLQDHNRNDVRLYEFAVDLFRRRTAGLRGEPWRFECDTERVCWDKSTAHAWWHPSNDGGDSGSLAPTSGSDKERILCAARRGCSRSDVGTASAEARNRRGRCLATVFVLGARKGGTTSLYSYLAQHPRFEGVRLDQGPRAGELLRLHDLARQAAQAGKGDKDAQGGTSKRNPANQNPNWKQPLNKNKYDFTKDKDKDKDEVKYGPGLGARASSELRAAYDGAFVDDLGAARVKRIRAGEAVTGESSVDNGPSCAAPRQVALACGRDASLRFIYLVRDPVERLVSQYKMRRRLGTLKDPAMSLAGFAVQELAQLRRRFAQTGIDAASEWWREPQVACPFAFDYANAVWAGMYVVHLARWTALFPKDQFLVLTSEGFFADPARTLRRALDFVGLDSDEMDVTAAVSHAFNAAPADAGAAAAAASAAAAGGHDVDALPDALRLELSRLYRPYNEALGRDFPDLRLDWA